MRTLLIAGVVLSVATGAEAQRVVTRGPGASYPVPSTVEVARPVPPPAPSPLASRWGSRVGGRWWGGTNAPGGWNAYRRPVRGYALPVYWVAPRFRVADWQAYGLRAPETGYNWVRYYDDAVLIDARGSVYDSVQGIDWDDAEARVARGEPAPVRGADRDGGLGGAAVGAAAGGVAGNLIAGRGDRLGGTLIGAGVGAAAGYAIDQSDERGRREPPPPIAPEYGPDPESEGHAPRQSGENWVSPDGRTTVVTHHGGYGGSTTTVTIQQAPIITTTTTEVVEDHVTYTRPRARRTWVRRGSKYRSR